MADLRNQYLASMTTDDKLAIIRRKRATIWRILLIAAVFMVAGVLFQVFYDSVLAAQLPDTKWAHLGGAVAFGATIFLWGCLPGLIRPDWLVREAATKAVIAKRHDLKAVHEGRQKRLGCLVGFPVLLVYAVIIIHFFF